MLILSDSYDVSLVVLEEYYFPAKSDGFGLLNALSEHTGLSMQNCRAEYLTRMRSIAHDLRYSIVIEAEAVLLNGDNDEMSELTFTAVSVITNSVIIITEEGQERPKYFNPQHHNFSVYHRRIGRWEIP
jgi:hypothetical protein